MNDKIRTIITGATGMVGEGVLHVCLQDDHVEQVLVINRRPCGVAHPKLKEVIHSNFFDLSSIEDQLMGYNACFFCLGVSSVGMKEDEYHKMTYMLTMHVAETLCKCNTSMTFCYISGAGTNSSEQGGSMWSRVKGKTENALMKLPFDKVFAFRPGFIKPIKGMKHTQKLYTYLGWMYPIGRALSPKSFCRLEEIAHAMIRCVHRSDKRKILEGTDIINLGKP